MDIVKAYAICMNYFNERWCKAYVVFSMVSFDEFIWIPTKTFSIRDELHVIKPLISNTRNDMDHTLIILQHGTTFGLWLESSIYNEIQ